MEQYLKYKSTMFWNTKYSVNEHNKFDEEIDLYVAIIVGSQEVLPWSDDQVGLSHYISESSEYGGLSVITMNYQNMLHNNEGLTGTTLHEISHLFGLTHPHDYWNPMTQTVVYSWVWGYCDTSLTYLLTSYNHDYYDNQLLYRIQIYSMIASLSQYNDEKDSILEIVEKWEEGSVQSGKEPLQELETIYEKYREREDFHILFSQFIVPSVGLLFIVVIIVGIFSYKKKI